MTCIVAIRNKENVIMGGDSLGSNYYNKVVRTDPKVFKKDNFVIGYTRSFRMGQILRHKIKLEVPKKDPDEYMFNLCNLLIKEFEELKFLEEVNKVAKGGVFLIAWENHLYEIQENFQYARVKDNYTSVGAGEAFALGSLYTTEKMEDRKTRILLALNAASKFSTSVGKPYIFRST